MKAGTLAEFGFVPEPVIEKREHGENMSGDVDRALYQTAFVQLGFLDWCRARGIAPDFLEASPAAIIDNVLRKALEKRRLHGLSRIAALADERGIESKLLDEAHRYLAMPQTAAQIAAADARRISPARATHHVMSERPPFFSVVTPSFNQAKWIGGCIESVLAQGTDDFEHIIFDNCSSDDTAAVVARHPHVLWHREPDRGQSEALNKAMVLARGEVICWLNADDRYLPGAFEMVRQRPGRSGRSRSSSVTPRRCTLMDAAPRFVRRVLSAARTFSFGGKSGPISSSPPSFFGVKCSRAPDPCVKICT